MPDASYDAVFTASSGNQARVVYVREAGSRMHVAVKWKRPVTAADGAEFHDWYRQRNPAHNVVRSETGMSVKEAMQRGDMFLGRQDN